MSASDLTRIEELEKRCRAYQAQLAALTAERDALDLKWGAASLFARQIVEALGYSQPAPEAVVNLEELAVQVLGQIERFKVEAEAAEAARDTLRQALVGLVGADTREELEAMEVALRMMPVPEQDRARTIDAIHALLSSAALQRHGAEK